MERSRRILQRGGPAVLSLALPGLPILAWGIAQMLYPVNNLLRQDGQMSEVTNVCIRPVEVVE
ncbi:MAG: hypothetical protein D6768_17960 [Chloroflexi bacterium]|nr:MAG: hypothetical protein D6768_17960 [Chloroflexota bacterium]